jgi:hypothetical protein
MKLTVVVKIGARLMPTQSPQSSKNRIHSRDQKLSKKSLENTKNSTHNTFHIMNFPCIFLVMHL